MRPSEAGAGVVASHVANQAHIIILIKIKIIRAKQFRAFRWLMVAGRAETAIFAVRPKRMHHPILARSNALLLSNPRIANGYSRPKRFLDGAFAAFLAYAGIEVFTART